MGLTNKVNEIFICKSTRVEQISLFGSVHSKKESENELSNHWKSINILSESTDKHRFFSES